VWSLVCDKLSIALSLYTCRQISLRRVKSQANECYSHQDKCMKNNNNTTNDYSQHDQVEDKSTNKKMYIHTIFIMLFLRVAQDVVLKNMV